VTPQYELREIYDSNVESDDNVLADFLLPPIQILDAPLSIEAALDRQVQELGDDTAKTVNAPSPSGSLPPSAP
jgi:hypothetical protein